MLTTPRVTALPRRGKFALCRAMRAAYGGSLRLAKERLDVIAESLVRCEGVFELDPLPYAKAQRLVADWRAAGGRIEIDMPLELLAAEG